MRITAIVIYEASSAETFIGIVKAPLSSITEAQRDNLRKAFNCDRPEEHETNNLFFRELELVEFDPTDPYIGIKKLVNIDQNPLKTNPPTEDWETLTIKRPERLLHSDKRAFMGDDIITALFMHYDSSGECPIYFRARINPKDKTYEASIYSTSENNTRLFTPEELLHACLNGSLKPENKEYTDETKDLTSYDLMRYVTSFNTSPIPPELILYP